MFYAVLFLFGISIGSFLNVLSLRHKEGQFILGKRVIGGRSRCLSCKRTLKWYELIPLASFIWQLGRCRSCGSRLSFQYPLVEFMAGVIVPAVAFYFFDYARLSYIDFILKGELAVLYAAFFIWSLVFLSLLLLSIIDFREYLIPDEISYFLAFLGICWVALLTLMTSMSTSLIYLGSFLGQYARMFELWHGVLTDHLLGAVAGSLAIGAIFFLSRGKAIGFGDVILLGVLGFLFGYPDIVLILFLAFLLGAILGIVLIARKRKGMKDFVPFAPFVAMASLLVFFFGADIMRFYFSVFIPF